MSELNSTGKIMKELGDEIARLTAAVDAADAKVRERDRTIESAQIILSQFQYWSDGNCDGSNADHMLDICGCTDREQYLSWLTAALTQPAADADHIPDTGKMVEVTADAGACETARCICDACGHPDYYHGISNPKCSDCNCPEYRPAATPNADGEGKGGE